MVLIQEKQRYNAYMRLEPLLGIRETGFDRAPWLPLDPRVTLQLYRSITYTIPLTVVDTQGVPVNLLGNIVTLIIKKRPQDHNPVFSVVITPDPINAHQGTFAIPAGTFDFILDGSYVFEVIGVFGASREPLIPISPLFLLPTGSKSAC